MARRPRKHIKAIPTSFNGVKYKSRLEARFAETLCDAGVQFVYEKPFPCSRQGYIPDFYLSLWDLYVEIKPNALIDELDIFRLDIRGSPSPWVCMDSLERGRWAIVCGNSAFRNMNTVWSAPRVGFESNQILLYPDLVTILPHKPEAKTKETDPEPRTVSKEQAREHFAKMRKLLGGAA